MNGCLINAVLDCGTADLNLLDDAECDFFKIVEEMQEEGIRISMNNIIREVFETGKQVIIDAYIGCLNYMENAERAGMITNEADWEQLQQLRSIDPKEDFSWWINLQDTHFYGDSTKKEIYELLFEEGLTECERLTGYEIEW